MPDLFKVLGPNGQAIHGGDAQWYLPKGRRPDKWMPAIAEVKCCERGYHLVEARGLIGWLRPGCAIYLAEGRGAESRGGHKIAYSQARLLRRLPWDETADRAFRADVVERACLHVERVLPVFETKHPGDDRPRKVIEAARTVVATLRAGDDAAARAATGWTAAAWAAARTATAWAAAAAWAAGSAEAAEAAAAAAWAAAAAAEAAKEAAGLTAWGAERGWQVRRLLWYLGIGEEPLFTEGFEDA